MCRPASAAPPPPCRRTHRPCEGRHRRADRGNGVCGVVGPGDRRLGDRGTGRGGSGRAGLRPARQRTGADVALACRQQPRRWQRWGSPSNSTLPTQVPPSKPWAPLPSRRDCWYVVLVQYGWCHVKYTRPVMLVSCKVDPGLDTWTCLGFWCRWGGWARWCPAWKAGYPPGTTRCSDPACGSAPVRSKHTRAVAAAGRRNRSPVQPFNGPSCRARPPNACAHSSVSTSTLKARYALPATGHARLAQPRRPRPVGQLRTAACCTAPGRHARQPVR